MPNRAERRAQEKRAKRGTTASRNTRSGTAQGGRALERGSRVESRRTGMVDEASLQSRSLYLQESGSDEWTPSSSTDKKEKAKEVKPDDLPLYNPQKAPAPSTARGWAHFFGWVFIVLSAIAFIVVMFLPNIGSHIWAIVIVAVVFVLGVLSLFLFSGSPKDNPNLDSNGTAV